MKLKSYLTAYSLFFATSMIFAPLVASAPEDHKVNLSALNADTSHHRFIVGFDATSRGNSSAVQNAVNEVSQSVGLGLQIKRQLATGAHVIELDSKLPEKAAASLMRAFARRAEVEYVEPDAMMRANFEPNDQYYPQQWHYYEALAGMNLPAAWEKSSGQGVVVAVLDTGRTDHSDLLANMLPGYDFIHDDFVSRDGDGRDDNPEDEGDWNPQRGECYRRSPVTNSSWHGTHVAGTIAAVTDNSIGVAGVSFNAMVVHARVLGRCGGYLSDISDAIVWASGGMVSGVPENNHPAQVINMSLGGSGSCDATYQNAINQAVANGATVVVSAGNSDENAAGFRPASCGNVITVAASDRQGNRAYYSNYGADVDITAPGGETSSSGGGVLSTLNTGASAQAGDTYVYYQGTSMSAPHISGLAALLYSVDPGLTPVEINQVIVDTARTLPGSCSGGCGAGLADAAAAVAAVDGSEPPPPEENDPPTANFTYSCNELTCDFTSTSSDDGPLTFAWTFGDGDSSTFENPSHSYGTDGEYTVTLKIDDGYNSPVSVNGTVSVAATPEPPTGDVAPGEPSNVTVTAQTTGNKRNRVVISAQLNWSNDSSVRTGFRIERCVETGKGRNKVCSYTPYAEQGIDPDADSWDDDDPVPNSRYRIRAVNAGEASDWVESNKI